MESEFRSKLLAQLGHKPGGFAQEREKQKAIIKIYESYIDKLRTNGTALLGAYDYVIDHGGSTDEQDKIADELDRTLNYE